MTKHTMPTARYKTLDDAICAHLESGSSRHPIYVESLARIAAAELGRGDLPWGDDKEWRLIDRRMQAMRKAGRIRHARTECVNPRWEVCNAVEE